MIINTQSQVHPEPIIKDTTITINSYKPEMLSSIYDEPHISMDVKCTFFCSTYKQLISILGFILLVSLIITIIFITKNKSTSDSNPCISYTINDLASSTTIECFRYLWNNAGCKATVPNGYNGWWLRSPQGGKTIICTNGITDNNCGAGNYGTILNNIYHCDLSYKGF